MSSILRAAAAAALLAFPAFAQSHDGIHVTDAYARVSGPSAQSGPSSWFWRTIPPRRIA
jgi:hypothetical protein